METLAGGGGVGVLVVLLLLLGLAIAVTALCLMPVRVRIALRQNEWKVSAEVEVKTPLYDAEKHLDISDTVRMALEHMLKRWRATGEPVKIPLQKTIRRAPRGKILAVIGRPLRRLGRQTRVERLEIEAEVGGFDAMDSAMLAGASWAVVGMALGQLSRVVQLEPTTPRVGIRPEFGRAMLRVRADCILSLRMGHAIAAGIWVARRLVREREILAWMRDSRRRKGVEGHDVRTTSDSGPDEDGHGEHQGNG